MTERKSIKTRPWFVLAGVLMLAVWLMCTQIAPSVRAVSESDVRSAVVADESTLSVESTASIECEGSAEAAELEREGKGADVLEDEDAEIKQMITDFSLFLVEMIEDLYFFSWDNADPMLVSMANHFSGYLGQLVFFGNWSNRRSGSFGRLMGLYGRDKEDPEILKHEHGHYVQFLELGLLKYIFAIASPSITHDPSDYYSQPWEVTADLFGGVTSHRHSPGSEEAGIKYLNDAKKANLFGLISACLG